MARRAIVLVLDGCGAGAAPDAAAFGDDHGPNTLLHTWNAVGGFRAPLLAKTGFLAAAGIPSEHLEEARYGRLREKSLGKDSVTGHWEMMGIETSTPFPTYPQGFPISLIKEFEEKIGTQTLGNKPESGTAILDQLGALHQETGFPIIYTSADSVFQIACHEEVVPIERLYELCEIARAMLTEPHHVARVIARPFLGEPGKYVRTDRRKDYPLAAPTNLVDAIGDVYGIGVVPELFAHRGFRPVRRTQSNPEHHAMLLEALQSDARFIFCNYEDFDMRYGHRNDAPGFARCLEEFDVMLGEVLELLQPEDLLLLTADHGNDPTDESTDHTREYAPVALIGKQIEPAALGDCEGLDSVGKTVADWLGVDWEHGLSLLNRP